MKKLLLYCGLLLGALGGQAQTQLPAPPSLPAAAAPDAPLGRLFFSPERRSILERQRQLNIRETQTLEGETLSLNGAVLRSSGKKTYWLNGRAQNDDNTPSGVTIIPHRKAPGRATVTAGGESSAELRIGESLNRATGEKQTGLGDGSITVKFPR